MKITAEPRSDQWNVDDFVSGPRTFTIAGVGPGKAEQKYDIELVEGEGRSWRPPPTVLRILMAAWGDESTVWVGRRVTLYADADVRFGPDRVGGIRISHLSHITKPLSVSTTVKRGKKAPIVVQPLPDAAPAPQGKINDALKAIHATTDTAKLDAIETHANSIGIGEHVKAALDTRRAELEGGAA